MSGRFSQVVEANWDDRIVFAESIPHLFHFDLLYLWMLERDPDRRSRAWKERIDGWRYLAALFLLGELQVEEEAIREPFLQLTRPFGIDRVTWLKDRSGPEQLGVLSPTVLVRPLPDFTPSALERWRDVFGDLGGREGEIRHFADLAVRHLTDGEGGSQPTFRGRLARVLERELGRAPLAHPPGGRHLVIPILRSLGWARPRLEAEAPVPVSLLVRDAKERQIRSFVPHCTVCNELLTRDREEEPVEARGPSVQIACRKGHANEIPLANFLIWYRGKGQVVIWADDRQVAVASPPARKIQGNEVEMEWNPGRVGGDPRRYLRLRFPEMILAEHSLGEIFFQKILIPGSLQTFRGLPIRPEWIDVLQNVSDVVPDIDPSVPKIVYRELALGGCPEPVSRPFGGLSLAVQEDIALGLYPHPRRVGPDWKWFRVFLDGPGAGRHRLSCSDARPVLPWVAEVRTGAPQAVWVESAAEPLTGSTFVPSQTAPGGMQPSTASAHVGVDFGTSNTLVAFYQIDRGGELGQPVTLLPDSLLGQVDWLAASGSTSWESSVGSFLPPRGFREGTEDRHLIPSALWTFPHAQPPQRLIRWDSREPQPGAEPVAGFKWGRVVDDRRSYLEEVLLLSLPAILAQMARGQKIADVHLGFSFPLAFDQEARTGMLDLLGWLARDLETLTGLRYHLRHVNESLACVNAFGTFQRGESFLVADMGGGTIDVALFTMEYEGKTEMHQIGSLRFAGEDGIQALVRKMKKGSGGPGDPAYWHLRDLIAEGKARAVYGKDQDAQRVMNRLVVFAFEYLRTMVVSFHKQHPGKPIRVVLVGNGWHLADALSERAQKRSPKSFFSEFYRHFLKQLGEEGLELYEGDPLRQLPASKHLVVRGALENTVDVRRQELGEEGRLTRLPAGRGLIFEPQGRPPVRIGWEVVLGEDEGAALLDASRGDLRPENLRFDLQDMPPLESSWRLELLDAFEVRQEADIPYPDEPQLRRRVGRSIDRNRIGVGPLQVILEGRWRDEELSR